MVCLVFVTKLPCAVISYRTMVLVTSLYCSLLLIRSIGCQCCLTTQTDPGATKLRQLDQTLERVECDVVKSVTYPDYRPQDGEYFDFIVVGAGSSGSVMANRLSENPGWRVLVLEAGGDPNVASEFPSLQGTLVGSQLDWNYTTEPNRRFCLSSTNQRCIWPRGKVLGGSSTINYMNYVRGHPEVFDSWEREGNLGWGFKNLLPYFKKSENLESEEILGNKYFHGENGYLTVETFYQDCGLKMFFQNLSNAYSELGYKTFKDKNAYFGDGLFYLQGTVRNGRRCSTAKAFIKPAELRSSLYISKYSLVKKVLFNKKTAYGVTFEKCGTTITVRARKEVILSAGAVNSPQLLMLSGIGPRDHLNDLGIQVISDLPVGYNLQDHFSIKGIVVSLEIGPPKPDVNEGILKVVFQSKATAEINGRVNAAGYLTTSKSNYPNIVYVYRIYAANSTDAVYREFTANGYDEDYKNAVAKLNINKSIFIIWPILVKPNSTGRILLKSRNPNEHPLIFPNYLAEEVDVDGLLESIAFTNRLVNTKAMKNLKVRMERIDIPGCKQFKFQTEDYWRCMMRYSGGTFFHPAGTCRMGPRGSPLAVVDPNLRVIGVSGLRVVDGSVMPTVTNGNLNAPIVAIAERASDLVKEFWK